VLAVLAAHPAWGTIALPLSARLYVREGDLADIPARHRPPFRTKLELAAELLTWAAERLRAAGKPLWVVADGAYAKAAFLEPAMAAGFVVVSRLRKDAALFTVQGPRPPGRRGRPRIYGEARIDLAKREGQSRGWSTGVFHLYGAATEKRYKTFLATSRPSGGVIRVVLVDEPTGWVAFFCTDGMRRWRRSSARAPTGSRSRSRCEIARRSSGRGSSRSVTCGPTWGRFLCAYGPSR
jgi:hypothetical protein